MIRPHMYFKPKLIYGFVLFFLLLSTMHLASETGALIEGCAYYADGKIERGFLSGKIVGKRYCAPDNSFELEMPAGFSEGFIEEHGIVPQLVGVAFCNHDGVLLKVQKEVLIEEVKSILSCHPEIEEELLDALFHEMMLVQLKEVIPGLTLLHEKKITLENGVRALYAVIHLPKASTIFEANSGTPLDSKRGYLLFFSRGTHLTMITLQDTLSLIPSVAEVASYRLIERLLNNLLSINATLRD